MSTELTSDVGYYKIVALTGSPSPVGITQVTYPPVQVVHLNQVVQIWKVEKMGDRFRLSIGGYPYSGVVNSGKVAASQIQEDSVVWHITYRDHGAFTIECPDDYSKVWTVSDEDSMIVIEDIQDSGSPNQWFTLEEIQT